MLFCSNIFLFLFLPVALALYYIVPQRYVTCRNAMLVIASLAFYAWGELYNVILLLATCLANYVIGFWLPKVGRAKLLLALGVALNLSTLFYYKYAGWSLGMLSNIAPFASQFTPPMLPLGISFFTFHAISYLMDIYRKDIKPARGIWDFACYFVMFPHLIAGPIVRFSHVAADLMKRENNLELFYEGLRRFVIGLAKKMLIANQVALIADIVFSLPASELGMWSAWLGAFSYTLQIYFDFSAYSDMAIGLAAMFGLRFHENFMQPYSAVSMQDFWRRWHISLSSWLRDYLYIPLGGSRAGTWRTYINLLLVFFLCGLWHGASWTFAVWGLYNGIFLIMERFKPVQNLLKRAGAFSHVYVILAFVCGWVIFRSGSMQQAAVFLKAMFVPSGNDTPVRLVYNLSNVFWVSFAAGIIGASGVPARLWHRWNSRLSAGTKSSIAWDWGNLAAGAIMLALSVMSLVAGSYNPFIYFRF